MCTECGCRHRAILSDGAAIAAMNSRQSSTGGFLAVHSDLMAFRFNPALQEVGSGPN
jgi:hypothetical protein